MMKVARFASTLLGSALAAGNWSTCCNRLQYKGEDVLLHGFSTTCPEYLLRGIGMKCWASYSWNDPSNIITNLNQPQVDAVLAYMKDVSGTGVKPALRLPMTASYWLGVETNAAKANMDKYPSLGDQYQTMISKMVDAFTSQGVVVILDLHWSDDDNEQTNMPLVAGSGTGGAIEFWESVAEKYASNDHVFYELYNEPHDNTDDVFIHGNSQYVGMLDMIAAVRKHSTDGMLVIAGGNGWAYDSESLIALEKAGLSDSNVMYNFHPYMGPNQAGDKKKTADGFEAMVQDIQDNTDKPIIITEFGQFCCGTGSANCDSDCYDYEGTYKGDKMGYDEAIITICNTYGVSWTPWSWLPESTGYIHNDCQDVNAEDSGTKLAHPTDCQGADWDYLWTEYSNVGPQCSAS